MAKNAIQFQSGLSLPAFQERYGSEDQCRAALIEMRWPGGFICPHCGCKAYSHHNTRHLFQCSNCRRQTSVTAGTIMQDTKLPLTIWFLAMYLLTQSKNDIAALELKRRLGIGYDAAWGLKHKLMSVMAERNAGYRLAGDVQIDDAVLGGERSGKRGRGARNKRPFVAAVSSVEGRPRYAHLRPVKRFSKREIKRWAQANLEPGARVVSDGLGCFTAVKEAGHEHRAIVTSRIHRPQKLSVFKDANTLLGNVKSAITGTCRWVSSKHDGRYLAAYAYRFNRRFDLAAMIDGLARVAMQTAPKPYATLIAETGG